MGNPNEIEIDPIPSFGHKTGMQAILSDVIDQKIRMPATTKQQRDGSYLTSLGMRAIKNKSINGVATITGQNDERDTTMLSK